MTAQVWRSPTLIAVTPLARPETGTGTPLDEGVASEFPSSPAALLPQQGAGPSLPAARESCYAEVTVVMPVA